jgi:uncharacterized protein
LEFDWDDTKAAQNLRKHGVRFDEATLAFHDPLAIERPDARKDYGEDRYVLFGISLGQVLTIVYTEWAERIRIISARRASRREQQDYYRQITK